MTHWAGVPAVALEVLTVTQNREHPGRCVLFPPRERERGSSHLTLETHPMLNMSIIIQGWRLIPMQTLAALGKVV